MLLLKKEELTKRDFTLDKPASLPLEQGNDMGGGGNRRYGGRSYGRGGGQSGGYGNQGRARQTPYGGGYSGGGGGGSYGRGGGQQSRYIP